MTDLGQRIAEAGSTLTPTERRLAELVINDPTTVAFGTVADLARQADTSGPSVVRFAAKLDFDGFVDLQDHVRRSLTEQLRRPTDRIRRPGAADAESTLTRNRSAMTAGLVDILGRIDDGEMGAMAEILSGTPGRVLVLCADTSAAPGRLLTDHLGLLRTGVELIGPSPTLRAATLADLHPDDTVVSIDFPRYEASIVAATAHAAGSDATVVALTDWPLSPLAGYSDTWIGLPIEAVGPFDSIVPAVALIELLVAEVAVRLRHQATTRLDRIEALWAAAGVFHPHPHLDRSQEIP